MEVSWNTFEDREECERVVIIWRLGRQLMSMSHKIHASKCCQSHIPVFVRLLIFPTGTDLLKLLLPGVQWAYLLMTFTTSQAQHMSILCLFSVKKLVLFDVNYTMTMYVS